MPEIASHAGMPAPERKRMSAATPMTITREIRSAAIEGKTCAQSTPDRAMGMDSSRSKIPGRVRAVREAQTARVRHYR